jgi:hypothetical protein
MASNVRLKQTNICEHCHNAFHPYAKEQKYCSHACYNPYRSAHRKKRFDLTCDICGKTYQVLEYRKETSHYCSRECWSKRHPPDEFACKVCRITFVTWHRDSQFCSKQCADRYKIGKRGGNYIDGKSLERDRARLSRQLLEWRKAVYLKDDFTCQICHKKGVIINAHHLQSWTDYPELRFDVSNGITLCIDCHGKLHNKNFSNRRNKTCPSCGASTTGRGINGRCKSCAVRDWHKSRRPTI